MFQSPVLFPGRSVLDNVLLPVDVQRLDRARYEKVTMDLLALSHLTASLYVGGQTEYSP